MGRSRLVLLILVVLLGFNLVDTLAQTPTSVPLSFPVHGYYVFNADSRLILVDTFTGYTSVLVDNGNRPVSNPHWNNQGDRITYNSPLDLKVLEPFASPITFTTLFPYSIEAGVFSPRGWKSDGSQILGIATSTDWNYSELQIIDIAVGSRNTLKRYDRQVPLRENSQLEFYNIFDASWNPVFDQWVIAQIDTFIVGTESNPERPSVTVGIVYNWLTGETRLLDESVIGTPIVRILSDAWSPGGQQVVLKSGQFGQQLEIISLIDESGNWQVQSDKSTSDARLISIVGWLGVEDLLLVRQRNQSSSEEVYSIAQILDGQLLTHEFFRIPYLSFSTSLSPNIGIGSWHLNANTAEKAKLSSLFDKTASPQP